MTTTHHISPYAYVGMVDCNIRTGKAKIKIMQPHETCRRIAQSICDFYSLPMDKLLSVSRRRNIVEPRQIAMFLMREKKVPLFEVGKFFGKDHTTVIHSSTTVKDILGNDIEFRAKLTEIRLFMQENNTPNF